MPNTNGDLSNEMCAEYINIPNPNNDTVSTIHRCDTEKASKLCIFDAHHKLQSDGHYDIGGTYLNGESDFRFHFTTTACPKQIYLLNLFVRCKSPRNFSICISDTVNVQVPEATSKCLLLKENLKWYSFRSVDIEENHYIKTFCFFKNKSAEFKNLIIPLHIRSDAGLVVDIDLIKTIKLQHNFNFRLIRPETPDFELMSANGQKFPAHKLVLGVHSGVLRNLIKEDSNSLFVDASDDEINLLLEFIYTGTIKDLSTQNSKQLLEIAKKFQVHVLFLLAQQMLGDQIDIDDVINIAVVAKKFNIDELLCKATEFIKSHPEVMETAAWHELNDIKLLKYFFNHMIYKTSYCLRPVKTESTTSSLAIRPPFVLPLVVILIISYYYVVSVAYDLSLAWSQSIAIDNTSER